MSLPIPDEGAYITVHLRSGKEFSGFVVPGHVWAEGRDCLCLAFNSRGESPESGSGENLWQYINKADIEAWTWDCRP